MKHVRGAKQKRKDRIRTRDRRMFKKTGACTICGKICDTEIHHFRYSDEYDERSIIEVCRECHRKLHNGRFHK